MLGDAEIKFTGNLAADPELRFTPSGKSVCSFSVGVTGRTKGADGSWSDGPVSWFQVSCWQQAENVAASLHKGDRVTVLGTMSQRSYETDAGDKRYAWDVTADEVAASLQFAQVQVRKPARASETAAEKPAASADAWASETAAA